MGIVRAAFALLFGAGPVVVADIDSVRAWRYKCRRVCRFASSSSVAVWREAGSRERVLYDDWVLFVDDEASRSGQGDAWVGCHSDCYWLCTGMRGYQVPTTRYLLLGTVPTFQLHAL